MAENYVLLETIELTQTAASVTFDNIPQTGYTDLKLVASMRDYGNDLVRFSMGFNSTSATTTTRRLLIGDGSTTSSTTLPTVTSVGYGSTRSSYAAGIFGNVEVYIPNYTSSNYKSFSVDAAEEGNNTSALLSLTAGLWQNTAAITSLSFICDAPAFAAGSTFSLYGIAALGTTPTFAPLATGGNIVANDGTYWYHAFLSSGTFTPQTELSCDYLVVAGGGGSGRTGGGGGAGGLRGLTAQSLTSNTSYPVIVGAGGVGSFADNGIANNGSNSSFNSTIASGGGGGASFSNSVSLTANAGGSGGGAGCSDANLSNRNGGAGNAGSYSPVEGYAGGNSTFTRGAAGGGGAGAAGSNAASSNTGGAGGNGSSSFSAWGLATNTGHNISGTVWFAGGGGGSGSSTGGAGGNGGGSSGGTLNSSAKNGVANTGGGAGSNNDMNGYVGGSGIVIIRYAMV